MKKKSDGVDSPSSATDKVASSQAYESGSPKATGDTSAAIADAASSQSPQTVASPIFPDIKFTLPPPKKSPALLGAQAIGVSSPLIFSGSPSSPAVTPRVPGRTKPVAAALAKVALLAKESQSAKQPQPAQSAKKTKKTKTKAPAIGPAEERLEMGKKLLSAMSSPKRHVMGIDQAFDGTGVAFVFPYYDIKNVEEFIVNTLAHIDTRFLGRGEEMVKILRETLTGGGGPLTIKPMSGRLKSFSFGMVWGPLNSALAQNDFPCLVLHGRIGFEASNIPEWNQARQIAENVGELALAFHAAAQKHVEKEFIITVEGLAMHGISGSLGILPCLGVLYGRIWEQLVSNPTLTNAVREMPIASWKKMFTGSGHAKKTDIKNLLHDIGFDRFGSDDESDAIAMALTAAVLDYTGKNTFGRIRPTREAQAESRQKRVEKHEKKAERERLKQEKAERAWPSQAKTEESL